MKYMYARGWVFFLAVIIASLVQDVEAQEMTKRNSLFRIYMDNDFFAYRKEDGGYSNGLRVDLFYHRKKQPTSFLSNFLLKAGDSAVNTYSWSVMQIMITSNDITKEEWTKGDYPYSGSLFVTHALNSVNPVERYAMKTEWILGVMGPEACAGEVQTWFHDLIGHHRPMGWHHQMPTALLLNVNLGYEKMLYSPGRALEVLGGGEMYMGTMYIGLAFQSTIRFGKMMPYFDGFVNRYSSPRKFQAYFVVKPQLSIVFHNTLLEGSLFRRDFSRGSDNGIIISESESNTVVPAIDFGLVLSYGRVAFSFTLNRNSGLVRDQPTKSQGNVSLYIGL
ncbi:MAG TPA: lipid A deacylase LpxR family protein [Cyclobacteriaceae bacterium]